MTTVSVAVNTYAHTVTHIASKMLMSLKTIIRDSGLDPSKLTEDLALYEKSIAIWLASGHLRTVILEIFHPSKPTELVRRWDIDVVYSYNGGDGSLWTDAEQLKYNIEKCGIPPSSCTYRVVVDNAPGRPHVDGWSACELRSTDGMSRYGAGSSIGGVGIAAETSYWART